MATDTDRRQLRIALVLHGWPPESAGGTGLYVGALARALAVAGHTVAVIARALGAQVDLEPQEYEGVEVWRLTTPAPVRWEETWHRPAASAVWSAWLNRWRPDVVHVHHLSGLPLDLLSLAHAARARTVVTLHDYALPCARGQLVDRNLQPCAGPCPERCAACLGEHLRLDPLKAAAGRLLARWPTLRRRLRDRVAAPPARTAEIRRVAERLAAVHHLLDEADAVLSPSADLARRFQAMGHLGIRVLDLPLLAPIPPAPEPEPGPVRLLFAGAIIPTKGPHRLVSAFSRLPAGAATLTLAGPTPPFDGWPGYAAELQARVARLPGATWLGPVPHDRMPELLHAHDVLVLPSTWPENSPLSIREARAAGLRVIVPAEGGATELAPDAPVVRFDDVNFDGDGSLLALLAGEVRRGRGRVRPARWPSLEEHVQRLLCEVYRNGS